MTGSHTFAEPGTFLVSVQVTDGEEDTVSALQTVTVLNPTPVVGLDTAPGLAAGDTLTSTGDFTNLIGSSWTAIVDYGDGSGPQPLPLNAEDTFDLSHDYAEAGTYSLTVSVTNDLGYVGTETESVQVLPTLPVVTVPSDTMLAQGNTLTGTGSFSDPNASSWTARVDYGDGSGSQPLTLNAGGTFALSHAYATSGTFSVVVQVTDGEGDTGDAIQVVTVLNPTPVIELDSANPINAGDTLRAWGSFTDAVGSSWSATADYGDGSGPQPLNLNADNTFDLSHSYTGAGTFMVTVSITNNLGYVGTATLPVQVFPNAPVVTLPSDATLPKGGTLTESGSFSDSFSSSWTATVDSGDGSGSQALSLNSDQTFALSHSYSTAGTYLVIVSVTGEAGVTGYAFQDITVVAPPSVSGVSPSSGSTNGGTSVTISGSGFTDATAVDFGDVAAAGFTVNSDGSITAVAPAGSAGTVDVTVVTAGGTSATSSADQFTYIPTPVVTGLSMTLGTTDGGTSLTISGNALSGATAVYFGDTAATSFTVNSDTTITAVAPEASGRFTVTVSDARLRPGISGTRHRPCVQR